MRKLPSPLTAALLTETQPSNVWFSGPVIGAECVSFGASMFFKLVVRHSDSQVEFDSLALHSQSTNKGPGWLQSLAPPPPGPHLPCDVFITVRIFLLQSEAEAGSPGRPAVCTRRHVCRGRRRRHKAGAQRRGGGVEAVPQTLLRVFGDLSTQPRARKQSSSVLKACSPRPHRVAGHRSQRRQRTDLLAARAPLAPAKGELTGAMYAPSTRRAPLQVLQGIYV